MVFDAHRSYSDRIATLSNSGELINSLDDDFTISCDFFDSVECHTADPTVPELSLKARTTIITNSTKLRTVASTVLSSYPDTVLSHVRDNDAEVEIITNRRLVENLSKLKGQMVSSLLSCSAVEIRITESRIPENLWIADTPERRYSGITVHSNGGVKGVLINDSSFALEWAEREYSGYREASEPLFGIQPDP